LECAGLTDLTALWIFFATADPKSAVKPAHAKTLTRQLQVPVGKSIVSGDQLT
jgi:hypothetical protein